MLSGNRTFPQSRQVSGQLRHQKEDLRLYYKGQEIPLASNNFYQVYRGVVQLYRIGSKDRETIVGWITANHAFGNNILENDQYKAIALSDVYLRCYSSIEVVRDPNLARLLIAELSHRLVKSEQMIGINLIRRVEDRLKALLLMLKADIGYSFDNSRYVRLAVRFTHQNLADAICTTRVTITRILGEWQERNLLEFDCDRHIIIKF